MTDDPVTTFYNITPLVTTDLYHNEDLSIYWQERVARGLWIYMSPFLLFLGMGGNILTYVVMRRPRLRKSVTTIYFRCLAIMDNCILLFGLLRQWIFYLSRYDIRWADTFICKVHTYLVYTFMSISVYTLVAVSFERCAVVMWPLWARCIQTPRMTYMILFLVSFFSAIFYLWLPILLEVIEYNGILYCTIPEVHHGWWLGAWPWVKLVVRNLSPFLMVFFSTAAILGRIAYLRHRRKNVFSGDEMQTLTIMMVAVAMAFIIGTTPITVYYIIKWPQNTQLDLAKHNLFWAIANMTNYLQFSSNFPLYVVTAPRFRREFMVMMGCRQTGKVSPDLHVMTVTGTQQYETNAND